ncbi:UNVERIFIED_CONTAM: hypothetical protein FKN15_047804 [Acipenser sinensis]
MSIHCRVLKPIVTAIDRLQGQKTSYYGELVPIRFAVESKLLQATNLHHCSHLLQAIVPGFQKRFGSFIELKSEVNESILAIITYPFFYGETKKYHQRMCHAAEELGLVSECACGRPNEEDNFFFLVKAKMFPR